MSSIILQVCGHMQGDWAIFAAADSYRSAYDGVEAHRPEFFDHAAVTRGKITGSN